MYRHIGSMLAYHYCNRCHKRDYGECNHKHCTKLSTKEETLMHKSGVFCDLTQCPLESKWLSRLTAGRTPHESKSLGSNPRAANFRGDK